MYTRCVVTVDINRNLANYLQCFAHPAAVRGTSIKMKAGKAAKTIRNVTGGSRENMTMNAKRSHLICGNGLCLFSKLAPRVMVPRAA